MAGPFGGGSGAGHDATLMPHLSSIPAIAPGFRRKAVGKHAPKLESGVRLSAVGVGGEIPRPKVAAL